MREIKGRGVELRAAGKEKEGEGFRSVMCDRVSVVKTKGLEVEDWVVVGEVRV